MLEPAEDKIVRNLIESLERLRGDVEKLELWTAALDCFRMPVPDYQPSDKFMLPPSPEREPRRHRF
jgi:hypothetical protein